MNYTLNKIPAGTFSVPGIPMPYFAQSSHPLQMSNRKAVHASSHPAVTAPYVIQLNTEGVILSWSKEMEKLNGYRNEEIIGQNFNILFLPLERQCGLPEHLLDMARRMGSARHQGSCVKKNGRTFCCNTMITANKNEVGKVTGFTRLTRPVKSQYKVSYIIYTRK